MTKPPGRRNTELEAWDRELRGDAGDGGESTAGEEAGPEVPSEELSPPPDGRGAGGANVDGPSDGAAGPSTAPRDGAANDPRRPAGEEELEGGSPAPWNAQDEGVTTEVLLRDLIIFQVKLLLDGLKDIVLSPLAIAAVLWDLVPSRNAPRGRAFYQILKVGERFDLWLNLYNPSSAERQDHEGLLEAGVHSADSLMGKLEQLARAEAEKKEWQGVVSPPLGARKPRGRKDPEA